MKESYAVLNFGYWISLVRTKVEGGVLKILAYAEPVGFSFGKI
jgi:hypothetical protein